MKTTDEVEFRSEDLGRRLAAWMASASPTHEPAGLVARAISQTASIRQRPGFLVRLGLPGRSFGLPDLSRRAQSVLLAGLLIVCVGTAAAVGARLLNQPTVPGVSNSLIVLVPDAWSGQIRAIRPDGQVVGVADGSTNGCGQHVLVADGTRVAYTLSGLGLVIAPLDGAERITVVSALFLAGTFSPDRTQYAYLAGTTDRADLHIVSLLDGRATTVARDLQGAFNSVVWSVNDTLAVGVISETEFGVDLIAADGTNRRQLVRMPRKESVGRYMALSWSPDGARLAFSELNLAEPQEAWLVDIVAGQATPVVAADGRPVNPWTVRANSIYFAWSPDSRLVTYRIGDREFGLLDLASGESRTVPDGGYPSWSPDGSRLAFLVGGDPLTGRARVTTMRADLSGRVDQYLEFGWGPLAWSPDSRQIAVRSGSTIELFDPDAIEPPIRILDDLPADTYSCLTWSEFNTP